MALCCVASSVLVTLPAFSHHEAVLQFRALSHLSCALQTAFLKGEISTVRSLQEKVDQYEAALDRLRKEIQVCACCASLHATFCIALSIT